MLRSIGLAVLFAFLLFASLEAAEKTNVGARPNVFLIMTDDQGWGDIRSHGNPEIATPNLDRLAASGARFDRFYVSPVCAPTRAGLLTGRYHLRTGTHGVTRGRENMRSEEVTIAERFQAAGYATGCFGKWHNGAHFPMHPNGQGFDTFVGFCAGHWNNYFDTQLERNGIPFKSEGFIADVLTDEASRFIRENATASEPTPFFCYVPLNTPHSPWQVPDAYFNKYQNRGLDEKAACAYAMCVHIDDCVGRLLATLEELKIADNTIVIFLTDNGPNSDRFNGEMRGRKGSVHEGGVRVPLFVRYPKTISPGTTIDRITANIDLFPTLVELCDLPESEDKALPLDGVSLVPLLLGKEWQHEDRKLLTFRRQGDQGAVRSQQWRAVLERGKWQLYDMQADPNQTKNLAATETSKLEELQTYYETQLAQIRPEPMQPLPAPLGYDQRELVSLPAHEAILIDAEGKREGNVGINYHGTQGWANDWISNWTSTEAMVTWDVEVHKASRYHVTLRYACPENSIGDKLQLEVGSQTLSAEVSEPSDEPFIESPDRIDRGEVYERSDWGRLDFGVIDFKPGMATIKLKMIERAGSEGLDVKAIELIREKK